MNKDFFNKTNIRKLSTTFIFILFVILLIVLLTQPVFHGQYKATFNYSYPNDGITVTRTYDFTETTCKVTTIRNDDVETEINMYLYFLDKKYIQFQSNKTASSLKRESIFRLSSHSGDQTVIYECISAILVFALYLIILLISGGFVWYDLNNFIKLKKLNKQKDGE